MRIRAAGGGGGGDGGGGGGEINLTRSYAYINAGEQATTDAWVPSPAIGDNQQIAAVGWELFNPHLCEVWMHMEFMHDGNGGKVVPCVDDVPLRSTSNFNTQDYELQTIGAGAGVWTPYVMGDADEWFVYTDDPSKSRELLFAHTFILPIGAHTFRAFMGVNDSGECSVRNVGLFARATEFDGTSGG